MIRIFYGTPGAGKSLNSLRDLVDELLYGTRLIVTNLPIRIGALNEYLQKKYPEIDCGDINNRIRIITESDTHHFYAFRSVAGSALVVPTRQESLSGKHVDYSGAQAVCYYIDEAHIAFDARNWELSGPELTFYASQHRKLSDECVFITQHPDMLEKRLRMLAQQFWSHVNNGLQRIWTIFSKPAYFSCTIYRKPPTGAPGGPPPEEERPFRLDKALADCYDTSAGIGIVGRNMPEKKRKSGISIFWLLVPVTLVVVLLIKAPKWSGSFFSSVMHTATEIKPPDHTGADSVVTIQPQGAPRPKVSPGAASSTLDTNHIVSTPVYVKSVAIRGKDAVVTLTDGRILTKGTGLARITKDYVETRDGHVFWSLNAFAGGPAQPAAR